MHSFTDKQGTDFAKQPLEFGIDSSMTFSLSWKDLKPELTEKELRILKGYSWYNSNFLFGEYLLSVNGISIK